MRSPARSPTWSTSPFRPSTATSTPSAAQIHILDYGDALLKPFSDKAHAYVAKVLDEKGVQIHLGTGVKEVGTGHARALGRHHDRDALRGLGRRHQGGAVAADGGLAQGRGGRVDVEPDLTLSRHERVYVIGDIANIPDNDDTSLPQLGSVALQSGTWAAKNILADFDGKPRKHFAYHDKGIMAMIGRGAAIGEVGKHHHEIHGQLGAHGLAGRARQPDDRNQGQDRGVRRLGLGRILQDRWPARARSGRGGRHQLGRRPSRSAQPARRPRRSEDHKAVDVFAPPPHLAAMISPLGEPGGGVFAAGVTADSG